MFHSRPGCLGGKWPECATRPVVAVYFDHPVLGHMEGCYGFDDGLSHRCSFARVKPRDCVKIHCPPTPACRTRDRYQHCRQRPWCAHRRVSPTGRSRSRPRPLLIAAHRSETGTGPPIPRSRDRAADRAVQTLPPASVEWVKRVSERHSTCPDGLISADSSSRRRVALANRPSSSRISTTNSSRSASR